MRNTIVVVIAVAALAVGMAASVKPPADFQAAMKENGATIQKLAKDVEAKDYDAVAASAAIFKKNFMGPVGKYFTEAKNDDGLKQCTAAFTAADGLEKAAKAKDEMGVAPPPARRCRACAAAVTRRTASSCPTARTRSSRSIARQGMAGREAPAMPIPLSRAWGPSATAARHQLPARRRPFRCRDSPLRRFQGRHLPFHRSRISARDPPLRARRTTRNSCSSSTIATTTAPSSRASCRSCASPCRGSRNRTVRRCAVGQSGAIPGGEYHHGPLEDRHRSPQTRAETRWRSSGRRCRKADTFRHPRSVGGSRDHRSVARDAAGPSTPGSASAREANGWNPVHSGSPAPRR